jgi:Ca2+-binding EF-hand superfamily protein
MKAQALATVLIIGLAAPVAASDQSTRQAPSPGEMRFRAMDQNRDGVIARREWRGSARSFRTHDWNGDGVLSGDEVRVGAAREQTGEEDYDPARRPEFRNWTEAGFTNLDRNGDGAITRAEWYYDREAFIRADRNRDNTLTKAEFLGGDVDSDREDRFEDLDVNDNRRIERSEWHGSPETFEWMDRNNDGVLSRMEVVGDESTPQDLFASLDENNDNAITTNEWQWSRVSFVRQDRNGDGQLSRRELTNAELKAAGAGEVGTAGRTIELNAARGWMDTGFEVRAGETITFQASGTVQLSNNPGDTAGPGGSGRRAQSAPIPTAPAGALIARIGDALPIVIGARQTMTARQSGRLYLSVNDDHLADNLGDYIVVIERR